MRCLRSITFVVTLNFDVIQIPELLFITAGLIIRWGGGTVKDVCYEPERSVSITFGFRFPPGCRAGMTRGAPGWSPGVIFEFQLEFHALGHFWLCEYLSSRRAETGVDEGAHHALVNERERETV